MVGVELRIGERDLGVPRSSRLELALKRPLGLVGQKAVMPPIKGSIQAFSSTSFWASRPKTRV